MGVTSVNLITYFQPLGGKRTKKAKPKNLMKKNKPSLKLIQLLLKTIDKIIFSYKNNNIICSLQNPYTHKPIEKDELNDFWEQYYAEMRNCLKAMQRYVPCPFDLEENRVAEKAAKKFFDMYSKIFYNLWD